MNKNKSGYIKLLPIAFCIVYLASCVNITPTPTIPWEPKKRSGSVPLYTSEEIPNSLDGYFDLDSAHELAETEGDIQYTISKGSDPIDCLMPVNGAKMIFWGKQEPTREDCQTSEGLMNDAENSDLEIGNYYCLLTNENNFSRLKIINLGESYGYSIRLEYYTWLE